MRRKKNTSKRKKELIKNKMTIGFNILPRHGHGFRYVVTRRQVVGSGVQIKEQRRSSDFRDRKEKRIKNGRTSKSDL